MLPPANLLATSSEGSKISQVAKIFLQKYLLGMFAVFNISSKVSFLVRRSVTTNDRVFGSTDSTSSGIGRISPSLKYSAYFSTLSLS